MNDVTPMLTPSFCANTPSTKEVGGAETQRIPPASLLKNIQDDPKHYLSQIFAHQYEQIHQYLISDQAVQLIPTLPAPDHLSLVQ